MSKLSTIDQEAIADILESPAFTVLITKILMPYLSGTNLDILKSLRYKAKNTVGDEPIYHAGRFDGIKDFLEYAYKSASLDAPDIITKTGHA